MEIFGNGSERRKSNIDSKEDPFFTAYSRESQKGKEHKYRYFQRKKKKSKEQSDSTKGEDYSSSDKKMATSSSEYWNKMLFSFENYSLSFYF